MQRVDEVKQQHPAWGHRRVARYLQQEGWSVSHKRVCRLYRAAGLHKVGCRRNRRKGKKGRRRLANAPAEIWACDWTTDEDGRGRPLVWIAIVDEFTRECVDMVVVRSATGISIVDLLEKRVRCNGCPKWIRADNDRLWQSRHVMRWRAEQRIGVLFIRRQNPWENGVIESFFAQLTNELLHRVEFTCLIDAQVATARWLEEYNHLRPMAVLGYRTPVEAANVWRQLSFEFPDP